MLESFPWALWSAGVVQKEVGTSYSIIVMYLPGTWAYARGSRQTTPGHSGHFCTVLHTSMKCEIKLPSFVARSEISNPECK